MLYSGSDFGNITVHFHCKLPSSKETTSDDLWCSSNYAFLILMMHMTNIYIKKYLTEVSGVSMSY